MQRVRGPEKHRGTEKCRGEGGRRNETAKVDKTKITKIPTHPFISDVHIELVPT